LSSSTTRARLFTSPPAFGGHHRLVEIELFAEGHGGLAGQTDHAQAVGAVGGNLKVHHMVVAADDGPDVGAGDGVGLVENEDAVVDAVGEFLLLGAWRSSSPSTLPEAVS
jgi:hypothetical protein